MQSLNALLLGIRAADGRVAGLSASLSCMCGCNRRSGCLVRRKVEASSVSRVAVEAARWMDVLAWPKACRVIFSLEKA